MEEDRRLYWIWMAETFGQGSATASKLIKHYKNPQIIFDKSFFDMNPESIFTETELAKIKRKLDRPSLVRAGEILARCKALRISVLTPEDREFPGNLKQISDMPMVLYVYGHMPDCSKKMLVAAVGTRTMSDYGRNIAYTFGAGFAFGKAVLVSGMALGTDSMALIGALDAGGEVIAFLGSGVDVIYPADHREIYKRIISHGAVVSEYPPGTRPLGRHFPVRNRLMSGISDATVVIEAGNMSGALITARSAVRQGKRVFAVPGRIGDSGSEGTNLLLVEGALPAVCAEDVLSEYVFEYGSMIDIDNIRASMRGVDIDVLSKNAMDRMRVGSRKENPGRSEVSSGDRNYYGSGTYGGRAPVKRDEVPGMTEHAEREKIQKEEKTRAKTERHKENKNVLSQIKEKISPKKVPENEKSEKKMIPAKKIELDMLDESDIKVYNKMRPDVPMLPDELVDDSCSIGDVMSALTLLEMAGAVEAGGGGYFKRVSPDDIMESIND